MTWTLTLGPPRKGNLPYILFEHDCGFLMRRSYSRTTRSVTQVCPRCHVREGYDLPSLYPI